VSDDELIADFVASLQADQFFDHRNPPPAEMNAGIDQHDWNCLRWKPIQVATPKAELSTLYERLHTTFPPLYERLILTWRWLDVWNDQVRFFANPPEASLNAFAKQVLNDPVFNQHLVGGGYIPFGLDIESYDPVCFDTNRRLADGDCMVIRFEHEAMLSFDHIGESWVLYPSCRDMMLASYG
jgi:hypothetical protein